VAAECRTDATLPPLQDARFAPPLTLKLCLKALCMLMSNALAMGRIHTTMMGGNRRMGAEDDGEWRTRLRMIAMRDVKDRVQERLIPVAQ
jgi:hypothetical protein